MYPQLPPVIGAPQSCFAHASEVSLTRPPWFAGCAPHVTPCSMLGHSCCTLCCLLSYIGAILGRGFSSRVCRVLSSNRNKQIRPVTNKKHSSRRANLLDPLLQPYGCSKHSMKKNLSVVCFWGRAYLPHMGDFVEQPPKPNSKTLVFCFFSIPVGQPPLSVWPTRPISLTLTQVPPIPVDRVVPIHGWRTKKDQNWNKRRGALASSLPGFSSRAVLGWWFDNITHVW